MTIIYLALFARGGTVAIEAVATCSLGGAKRMVNGIELIMLMIHDAGDDDIDDVGDVHDAGYDVDGE